MAKLMEISGFRPGKKATRKAKKKKARKRKGLGTGTRRGSYPMVPEDSMSPLHPMGAGAYREPYIEPPTGTPSDLLPPTPGNIAGIKDVQDAEAAFKTGDYNKALRLANKAAKSRNRGIKQDAAWIKYRVNRAKKMGVKIK